jgi:hypothetical protein
MNNKKCSCNWCGKITPLISKIKTLLNESENIVFNEMINSLMTAEIDAVYWKDKYYGTWPSDSIKNIQNHIERLKDRIEELESLNDYKNSLRKSKE